MRNITVVLSQSITKVLLREWWLSSFLLAHSNSSLLSTTCSPSPCWELYFLRLPYKVPQTEWFKMTESYFSQSWRPEVQSQGVGRTMVSLNPLCYFQILVVCRQSVEFLGLQIMNTLIAAFIFTWCVPCASLHMAYKIILDQESSMPSSQ